MPWCDWTNKSVCGLILLIDLQSFHFAVYLAKHENACRRQAFLRCALFRFPFVVGWLAGWLDGWSIVRHVDDNDCVRRDKKQQRSQHAKTTATANDEDKKRKKNARLTNNRSNVFNIT